MRALLRLLALPAWGPVWLPVRLAQTIAEQADRELYDEDKVRAELMELELRVDSGEMDEEQALQVEEVLLDRLRTIQERKMARGPTAQAGPGDMTGGVR